MEDEYGMSDLSSRQFMVGGRPAPPICHPPPHGRSYLTTDNQLPYNYMLNFRDPPNTFDHGGRWPRQETLTLLEIRSRLDSKFKEANQKGPLWDELSRIMCEESGYQRSGKKCREKFENLYKYYKKTKTRRQDGKHYRFFRQLEALYGDTTTHNNNNNSSSSNQDFINISNSSDFDNFISSDEEDTKTETSKRSLKEKIKESIEMQMKEMMEKQEAWMEMMMKKMEANEQESVWREEQRRREDVERIEREQRMWAREKASIQARDAVLMDAFMKITTKEEANLVYSTSTRPEEAELMDVGFGIDIISSHHHQQQNHAHQSISEQGSEFDKYFGGESYGGL